MKRTSLVLSLFLVGLLVISGCQELNENVQTSGVQGSVTQDLQNEEVQSGPQVTNTCGGQCGGNCEMSTCGCNS